MEVFDAVGICDNAADSPQLRVSVLGQTVLQILVVVGVDPVVFHLLERRSGFDLGFQRRELMVARHELESGISRLERARLVAEMCAQLAELQVYPRIVGLLERALFGVAQCLVEP